MEKLIAGFFLALSVVLIILGGIVSGSAKKSDNTSQTNVKNSGTGVLVIGILFLCASAGSLFHLFGGTSKLYYF
jgi:hypothetical protein